MSEPVLRTNADFDSFYERNWKYVYRLCFSYMKQEADAEDCTEDVFVKVLTSDICFTDETHERKWLTVTAMNLCKDRLKRMSRKEISLDEEGAPEPAVPEPDDYSDVREAVLALPERLKDIIWMFYYEGYRADEIAEMLGSPPSTIRNRLRDARNLLKEVLGGECFVE